MLSTITTYTNELTPYSYLKHLSFSSTNSNMASAVQSKITYSDIIYKEDGWYYIGDVKITGVSIRRTSNGKTKVFTENRVAMTKNEQKKLGSKQPYMLPQVCIGPNGPISQQNARDALWEHIIVKCREAEEEKTGKGVALMRGMCNPYSEESPVEWEVQKDNESTKEMLYWATVMRQSLYSKRHFPMPILREALKKNEHPHEGLCRLIEEECREELLMHPDIKFVYYRTGRCGTTAQIVYDIDDSLVGPNEDANKKRGNCNYFCAKAIPYFGINDYLETRNPVLMSDEEVSEKLKNFTRLYGENGIGCDLSRWGALAFWNEFLKK